MLRVYSVLSISLLLLFLCSFPVAAQVWEEWSHDKEEVFEMAKEQGKHVLLFVGHDQCPVCQYTSGIFLAEKGPLASYLRDHYVGLYCLIANEENRAAVMDYISEYWEIRTNGGSVQIPWLYVIDPNKPGQSIRSTYDRQTEAELLQFITLDLPNFNDPIALGEKYVTVLGHILQITNQTINEQIQIFTLTGQRVFSIRKTDFTVNIDVSKFPKGILIIQSTSGWSSKVFIK
jgi:hypothetical protein